MLSVAHTIISLPFGLYLTNPVLIFTAAFLFHIFCDSLLHWNIFPWKFKSYPYHLIFLDVVGGLVLAWLILNEQFFTITVLAAIAGGNMPDIMNGVWDILKMLKKQHYLNFLHPFFNFHDHMQIETYSATRGLISQVVMITAAIVLILLAP